MKLLAKLNALVVKALAVKKAVVAFLLPNAPVIVLLVQRQFGAAGVAEVVPVLTALGVYSATNKPKAS